MKSTDIPTRLPELWAQNGLKNAIPTTTATAGAASLDQGFPPITMVPLTQGGMAPSGRDMNGILNLVTAWSRWTNAGAPTTYDADFSAIIGGYPRGAVLANATTPGAAWVSTVDDNETDPDAGGANWTASTTNGMPNTTAALLMLFTAMAATLPTTLPSTAGQLWLNGGTLCIS